MENLIQKTFAIVIVAFLAISFTTIENKKEVKLKNSKIVWKGYKITGSHQGLISIKSGHIVFNKEKLTGGEFIIDMPSITCTDLEGKYKVKLEGHLKSDDFFGVEKFPTASLIFTQVKYAGENSYKARGNITIKDKTEKISFNISVYRNKANAILTIDRTKFNVKYGSTSFVDGLKDKAIYDEFDLDVKLEF